MWTDISDLFFGSYNICFKKIVNGQMNFSIIKFIEKNADFVAANNRRAALLRFVLVNSAEKVLA